MAKVDDVAAALIERVGPMPAMKLQKLVYYCQAWHLVWEGKALFSASTQAWANGPVVPMLYRQHRGDFWVQDWPSGDRNALRQSEVSTVEAIVGHYGDKEASWLSDLTHREDPWRDARAGQAPGERGHTLITTSAMFDYYSQL